jgi:hypothetical protein
MCPYSSAPIFDEVVKRLHLVATTEIEGLKRVVHERGHFAELAAQEFLNRRRRIRRRMRGHGQFDGQFVDAKDHGFLLSLL